VAYPRILLRTGLVVIVTIILSFIVTRVWNARVQGEKSLLHEESRLIESVDGASLYQAYCASCHGTDGKGGGPAAVVLTTKVPDLTRLAEVNGGNFPSDRVREIISGDQPGIPAHGSREMPIWGPIFKRIAWDQDLHRLCIYNLTKYLESLQHK
jgi:hypothetical protein